MMNSSQKIFNKIINLTKVKKGIFKINSKDIKKGDIFVALKGNKFHGNRFIEDALINTFRFPVIFSSRKFAESLIILPGLNIFDILII